MTAVATGKAAAKTATAVSAIRGWHAHVYFDPATREKAVTLRQRVAAELGLVIGSVHDRPVGPHTAPMFQIMIANDDLGRALSWLALNRDGLDVLIHPSTGDHLADHTAHATWMGHVLPVNEDALR